MASKSQPASSLLLDPASRKKDELAPALLCQRRPIFPVIEHPALGPEAALLHHQPPAPGLLPELLPVVEDLRRAREQGAHGPGPPGAQLPQPALPGLEGAPGEGEHGVAGQAPLHGQALVGVSPQRAAHLIQQPVVLAEQEGTSAGHHPPVTFHALNVFRSGPIMLSNIISFILLLALAYLYHAWMQVSLSPL
eukprot:CAMPEP_0194684118 /NCGR_PEP_ID=MMETSP0295-20121207/13877_1 /TAXON_ID=39354 /ORGANISM="Heterosigma akashiwo, Strain CCMP2393" /LENGTH=192 /DNA_ID=CAMNT_0039571011 /DNA_START=287 /DNA_END=866 /DNA_ORIENTATION=-